MSVCIDYSYQLIEVIWDHNLIFIEPNFSFYRIKPVFIDSNPQVCFTVQSFNHSQILHISTSRFYLSSCTYLTYLIPKNR